MSEFLKRKELPLIVIWISVFIVFADYFIGGTTFNTAFKGLTVEWTVIIANIAIVVGGIAVLQRSLTIARRERMDKIERFMQGWQVFVAVFLLIIGTVLGINSTIYSWIYTYILLPSWRTIYTIIIFFMATASYRAFKARSGPSTIMLICGIIVLLRNAPIGTIIWSGFFPLGSWILDVVNMSGNRAIMIGSVVGAISLLVRILIGKEKILGED